MSSEFKLSDQTSVALPVKNIVAIIYAVKAVIFKILKDKNMKILLNDKYLIIFI